MIDIAEVGMGRGRGGHLIEFKVYSDSLWNYLDTLRNYLGNGEADESVDKLGLVLAITLYVRYTGCLSRIVITEQEKGSGSHWLQVSKIVTSRR